MALARYTLAALAACFAAHTAPCAGQDPEPTFKTVLEIKIVEKVGGNEYHTRHVHTRPAVADGKVFMTGGEHGEFTLAYDTTTGVEMWRTKTDLYRTQEGDAGKVAVSRAHGIRSAPTCARCRPRFGRR